DGIRDGHVTGVQTCALPISVIAIDIPLPGATFFGADNYRAGRIAGDAAARWIREYWNGKLDKLVCLEQPESGPVPAARIQGQIEIGRASCRERGWSEEGGRR